MQSEDRNGSVCVCYERELVQVRSEIEQHFQSEMRSLVDAVYEIAHRPPPAADVDSEELETYEDRHRPMLAKQAELLARLES